MSFILDALRKSDAERQRGSAPGLADVRYATRRSRRNIWLPILVATLAANMVFMGVQWFSRGSERPPTSEIAAPNPSVSGQQATAPAPVEVPAPPADIRPLARETEFGEPSLEPEMDREFAPAPDPVGSPPVPEPSPVAPATPSRILANNEMPTAEQLIGSGAISIPILNLDLHVYSDKPASRFAIINSRKYKEGGQLAEGPVVESITRDGVILAYQGRKFTLSRR